MPQSQFSKIMLTVIIGAPLVAIFYGIYAIFGEVPDITTVRWHQETSFAFPAVGMETRLWDIFFLPIIASACVFEVFRTRLTEKEKSSHYLFASLLICIFASLLITFMTGPYLALMFGAAIGFVASILSGFEFGRNCMRGFALGTSVGVALYTGGMVGAILLANCGLAIVIITLLEECLVWLWALPRKLAHRHSQ